MRVTPCKVCQNQEFDFLFKGQDRLHYISGVFDLFRCRRCGLIMIYPQLDDAELALYYPTNYYSYKNSQRASPTRSFLKKLFFYMLHPFQALNCLGYSKLLNLNKDLKCKPGSHVLDVGCGDGRYLIEKLRSGCLCFGNDVSKSALDRLKTIAPDIETRCGNLWEVNFPGNSFDRINLSHVLEHVRDIDKLLPELRRILKTDGLAHIQVPNSASINFTLFGKFWMPLDVPRHVYAFSLANMEQLLSAHGFELISSRTIENSFSVIGSVFYVLSAMFQKKWEIMRFEHIWNNEFLKLILFPYALMVNLLRRGDTAEFIVRKASMNINVDHVPTSV